MSSRKSIFVIALTAFAVCVLAVTSACFNEAAQPVEEEQAAPAKKQIITVGVDSPSDTYAEVKMLSKEGDGPWTTILSTNGRVGKYGVGKTKEGDSRTPAGIFKLTQAFGIKDNPGTKFNYLKVDNTYYWVDDPNSKYYNMLVTTREVEKDWNSAENILGTGTAYNYVLSIGYNTEERTPGVGSAIFLHVMNNSATAGCVSVPEADMIKILNNVELDCLIFIDTKANIESSDIWK